MRYYMSKLINFEEIWLVNHRSDKTSRQFYVLHFGFRLIIFAYLDLLWHSVLPNALNWLSAVVKFTLDICNFDCVLQTSSHFAISFVFSHRFMTSQPRAVALKRWIYHDSFLFWANALPRHEKVSWFLGVRPWEWDSVARIGAFQPNFWIFWLFCKTFVANISTYTHGH